MILNFLLNTRTICMIFIKTLKNTSQIKNLKYKLFVMIGLLICFVIKKLNSILTELFIRGIKLNISFVFVAQYYIAVPKNIKSNSTHYLIMKIPDKQELQQIPFNHSSDIDFKNLMNLYKKYTGKPYSFLVLDDTLASDNPKIKTNHENW